MGRAKALGLILTTLIAAVPLAAETEHARPPHTVIAEINQLTRSAPPRIEDRWVIFTYRPAPSARYVALRFEHEDYAILHPMALNEKLLFVLVYEPPTGLGELTYRMSVDGMWMRDPANPDYTTDAFGTPYSRVDLSAIPAREPAGPHVREDGRVTFLLHAPPGELVTLAGSFNRWDPFVHVMDEMESGVYELTLRLAPGVYYYYFLENGRKTLDPTNRELKRGSEGEIVNSVVMP